LFDRRDDGALANQINHRDTEDAQRITEKLIDIFGRDNVYAELQRHFNRDEEARNHAVIDLARN
jgi:error-prone DNA polymerase